MRLPNQQKHHYFDTWADVERRVLRYQTRIYKATKENKREKVMPIVPKGEMA